MFITKKNFLNKLLTGIGSSRVKRRFLKTGGIILFCGFQSSYGMEREDLHNYYHLPDTHKRMVLRNEGDSSTFISSQKTREALGSAIKGGLTTFIDHQIEEQFPTRNSLQNIDLGNLTQRIFYKGLVHVIFNIVFEIVETGATPTENKVKTMMWKTLIDVAASECLQDFMPSEHKHVSKVLFHTMTHSLFQTPHLTF